MLSVTPEKMKEIDRKAQDVFGIPQVVLMENAGRVVVDEILKYDQTPADTDYAVFSGPGNNGGDGFVVARYLSDLAPRSLKIYVRETGKTIEGAARVNLDIIINLGLEVKDINEFKEEDLPAGSHNVAIDGLFGTGFHGMLPGECIRAGRIIKKVGATLFSIDIPSGLDATTGEASEDCFKAHKTVTFGLPKKGFYLKDGPGVCGEVIVRNIGFPRKLLGEYI